MPNLRDRVAVCPRASLFVLGALLAACPKSDTGEGAESGSSGTTGIGTNTSASTSATTASTTASTTQSDGSGSSGDATTMTTDPSASGSSSDGSGSSGTTGNDPGDPLDCGGAQYACGDGMDNDRDGFIDLMDPECTGPCDDDESSFQTGLPGDNMDCKQDCFFDGNSGGGAGDCAWDLKCDPLSPGGDKCPYDPDFKNCPDMQSMECVMTCQVPNGCDCFGCCTVVVEGMSYDVFIGDPDCSLNNIATCQMCTKNDDCDDECVPENCEICFGQTEPPPGCTDPDCTDNGGMPCMIDDMGGSNCPEDMYCQTGCCVPIVPG